MIRKVSFDLAQSDPSKGYVLLPLVDDVSLVDLVSGYELAAGFDSAGAYAGLVLNRFRYGDLTAYLTGQPDSPYWSNLGVIALLGCTCGEVGCWPLYVQVVPDKDFVTWRGFSQPHRPQRDYGAFGPFTFRRSQYEHAARQTANLTNGVPDRHDRRQDR